MSRHTTRPNGQRKFQNVSLQRPEWLALRLVIAAEERDGNVSAAVARLIRKEMVARLGPNWQTEVVRLVDEPGVAA